MTRPPIEAAYFKAVETVENVVLRWVPIPVMTGIMASPIPAAMRRYSMAVAANGAACQPSSRRPFATAN